jgi:hypothetical protein
MRHVAHPQADKVTPSELAVDREVEYGEVAHFVRVLQMNADGPDVLGFERCLLANQLPLVPGFPMRMFSGFHDRLLAVDRSLILEPVAFGCYRGRCPQRTIGQWTKPLAR